MQVYSVVNRTSREVWKIKPRWTAASVEHSPRRPSSVVRTKDDDEVFVTGLTLYAGDGGQPPGHNPFGHNPFSAAVGHRGTEPGGYFCWKLTVTCTSDPLRPTRPGLNPNRPTNGSKQGGYDLGVFVRRVVVGHPGDNRRQQNRI